MSLLLIQLSKARMLNSAAGWVMMMFWHANTELPLAVTFRSASHKRTSNKPGSSGKLPDILSQTTFILVSSSPVTFQIQPMLI